MHPVYVSAGLAWEAQELAAAESLLARAGLPARRAPLATLTFDMRDVYPPTHWAIRGEPPAFDTPDEDVYLDGRNIVLLAKAAVFMARAPACRACCSGRSPATRSRTRRREFFDAMAQRAVAGAGAADRRSRRRSRRCTRRT